MFVKNTEKVAFLQKLYFKVQFVFKKGLLIPVTNKNEEIMLGTKNSSYYIFFGRWKGSKCSSMWAILKLAIY